jgi:FkbM family methyltransferase
MNAITRTIHRLVINTKAEEILVRLRRTSNILRTFIPKKLRHVFASFGRFIPASTEYPPNDAYFLTRDGTHFKINRSDYVQWRLFYGVRDNALKMAIKTIRENSVIFDVGANFGAFSLKLATHVSARNLQGVSIHAFEPNPRVIENYLTNLELNDQIKTLINLHRIGVGEREGSLSFAVPGGNTGAGRIVDPSQAEFSITVKTLDSIVEELRPGHIAFIKLIVEGFEPEAIRGGWRTIEKYRPPIFFEVTPAWWQERGNTVSEVTSALERLGYRFWIEHHNELLDYTPANYRGRTQFNLFASIDFASSRFF